MPEHTCDVAIIGAGTSGLAAERAARSQGASTLLIDDEFAGTVCATVGCMPSKLLIAAASAAHASRRAPLFGVHPGDVKIDGPAVMQRVREERDKFAAGTLSSFDDLPAGTCIKARARFTECTRLALDNGDTVLARSVVIATGSSPLVPDAFRNLGELALTNRTIFEIESLPASLAVVGGGTIGLELAQAMTRLGVATVLFDHGESLGPATNEDVQAAVAAVIGDELTLQLGVQVSAQREHDQVSVTWSGASEGEQLFDRVLVAAGRPPQLKDLDLETTGLALDEHGVPCFDRTTMQCGTAPIFMAGDADADAPVLHEASTEGAVAGQNAATYPHVAPTQRTPLFSLTFTDPPLAMLGAGPTQGGIIGHACYANQGRAKIEARAEGLVRIYATDNGTLTGAELFAPGADHMAHVLLLAIMRGETAASLLDLPLYHPTLEEGLKPALREICAAASTPQPADRDSGDPSGV